MGMAHDTGFRRDTGHELPLETDRSRDFWHIPSNPQAIRQQL
jgi:hypothetical protein